MKLFEPGWTNKVGRVMVIRDCIVLDNSDGKQYVAAVGEFHFHWPGVTKFANDLWWRSR